MEDNMDAKENKMTSEGLAKYEERLEYLKTIRRQEIAEQIKQARAFGDLSENAEYDEAKNEQARIEYEIMNIENMLRNAIVIDESSIDTNVVNMGAAIKVKNVTSGREIEYFIVGSAEANPLESKISNESPVGRALIGHGVGDVVGVHTPNGVVEYKVLGIRK
jgi:transcription elongation factor GreA